MNWSRCRTLSRVPDNGPLLSASGTCLCPPRTYSVNVSISPEFVRSSPLSAANRGDPDPASTDNRSLSGLTDQLLVKAASESDELQVPGIDAAPQTVSSPGVVAPLETDLRSQTEVHARRGGGLSDPHGGDSSL